MLARRRARRWSPAGLRASTLAKPPSSTATAVMTEPAQHPPQARRVRRRAPDRRRRPASVASMPEAAEELPRRLRAKAADAGRSCPFSAPTGRDRGARIARLDMVRLRYSASPQVSGLPEIVADVDARRAMDPRVGREVRGRDQCQYMAGKRGPTHQDSLLFARFQRAADSASSSRRMNSWKCCMPSSIGD